MEQEKIRLANKSPGELLTDGFRLFGRHYLCIIIPFVIFYLITIVLSMILLYPLKITLYNFYLDNKDLIIQYSNAALDEDFSMSEMNIILTYLALQGTITLLEGIIGGVLIAIATCSVSSFLYKSYMGEEPDFFEEFKKSFNKKMIPVVLILGLLIPGLMGLFWIITLLGIITIVLAIVLWRNYVFSLFTYNDDQSQNPLQEAKYLASGNFLKILGILFLSIIVFLIVDSIYSFALLFILPVDLETYLQWNSNFWINFGLIFSYELAMNVFVILFAPLFVCLLTPLFARTRARKEMAPQNAYPKGAVYQAPYPVRPPTEQWKSEMTSRPIIQKTDEKGIFCPFCGYKNPVPKKFCPNCGESLEFNK